MPDETLISPAESVSENVVGISDTPPSLVGVEATLPAPAGGATAFRITDINLRDGTFSWQFGDFVPAELPEDPPVFAPAPGWQGCPFAAIPDVLTIEALADVVSKS